MAEYSKQCEYPQGSFSLNWGEWGREDEGVLRGMLLEEVTFTLNNEILKNTAYVSIMTNDE